ncbi:MAG TPA: hypothetical protein VI386_35145 [Candidatus Sulfotelmatobacter sp.]
MKKTKEKSKPKQKSKTESKSATKSTGKKAGKKSAKKSLGKKDANPAEMRRLIANIVGGELGEITLAVVGDAKKGQLATVKYLWEVAGVYPMVTAAVDTEEPTENCLTQRLIRRLGLPDGPLPNNEDEDSTMEVVVATAVSVGEERSAAAVGGAGKDLVTGGTDE